MKIVMSADRFYPAQTGGPSNTIYWQAKALSKAGHDVTVIATSQDLPSSVPLNCWLNLDCGRVIYTQNLHFYFPVKHIWYGWQAIRNADMVHINSLFYPASLVWLALCRLIGKPVALSPHGELSPAALQFRPRLKWFLLNIFRWMSAEVSFHATCAEETMQIQATFGSAIRVREIKTMMELPASTVRVARPYLLFMGRLHPIKAIDRLLEALSASKLFRDSNYSLQIAGPNSDKIYTQQLKELVLTLGLSAKVVFLGAVQGEHKEQLYADAYLLVLPSHSENFGNVVIESLAQGTPVVASTKTPWQVLDEERAGRWVSNDRDSLRQAIERFLSMAPDEYELCRIRASSLARRDYDISVNSAVWSDFYEGVKMRKVPANYGLYPAKNTS